jgi:hypothetical protein
VTAKEAKKQLPMERATALKCLATCDLYSAIAWGMFVRTVGPRDVTLIEGEETRAHIVRRSNIVAWGESALESPELRIQNRVLALDSEIHEALGSGGERRTSMYDSHLPRDLRGRFYDDASKELG